MRFLSPWWLLALIPALPVVVTVARFGRRTVPARQHKAAVTMRATGVVLLVLALAQPLLVRSSPQRSVLFLLDRSSSVTTQAREAQEMFGQQHGEQGRQIEDRIGEQAARRTGRFCVAP